MIPSVDLNAFLTGTQTEQRSIAADVDEICQSIGFLIVRNHGVSAEVIDNAWSTLGEFFDLPLAEKLKSKSPDPHCPRGYFPMASEALSKSLGVDTPPDIKERFGIGSVSLPPTPMSEDDREFHFGENLWPGSPPHLRENLIAYFDAVEDLGLRLLRLFAAALKLPQDYFETFHSHPRSALSCLNYPYSNETLLPNQRGAGEHSDYGTLTMLKPDPQVPGLEIKMPSGEWEEAPLVEDMFIINIGDLMARWTNDRWVSTMHRVIKPGAEKGAAGRRQSIAFFQNTNFDAKIECIPTCLEAGQKAKYEPVLAGDYLKGLFLAAQG